MTGLIWFQLIILTSIAGLYLLIRTRLPKKRHDWQYGTPVHEVQGEKLTDISNATWLWQQSGIMCTLLMLENLEKALQRAGYELTKDPDVTNVGYMLPHLSKQVAADLLRARELFWAPQQRPEIAEEIIRLSQKSGFDQKMLLELLSDLHKRGWRLRQIKTDLELHTYPLQQVVIKITGRYDSELKDFALCLMHLVSYLNECSLAIDSRWNSHNGIYNSQDMSTAVRYAIKRRLSSSPPGFFPASNQTLISPVLVEEMREFNASLENHFVVILQGTRTTQPRSLSHLLQNAIARLEAGEIKGWNENDNTGYAFCSQGLLFR